MFGAILDAAMNIPRMMHAEEMQNDMQAFNSGEAGVSRSFNSAEAISQRDFAERMSSTAFQRGMADMSKAGLNPMLAAKVGGADSPAGSSASSSPASSGSSLAHLQSNFMQSELNSAVVAKTNAETKEIQARTPTHAVSIEQMQQNIQKMIAETSATRQHEQTSAASQRLMDQQVRNYKEQIEQIKAQVELMKSQRWLTDSQDVHKRQLIGANLPQIERALKDVELEFMELERPRRGQESSSNDRFVGALGALLRTLNPLGGLIRSVR